MVVCSENVNSLVVSSCYKLVVMVCNVGNDVGRYAVSSDKNYILIVAKFARLKPKSTVKLVGNALFL